MNPVPRLTSWKSRRAAMLRAKCDPLTAPEVALFLAKLPARFQDLYEVWFRTGWRPSEIVGLRFEWLDFERHEATLRKGRIPRRGGSRGAAEDRRADRGLRLRRGNLRGLRAETASQPRAWSARLCLRRRGRQPALTGVAPQEDLAADPPGSRPSCARAVQHPRHVHHARPLGGGGSRLGGRGVRNVGADDLPALPEVDAECATGRRWRRRSGLRRPGWAPDGH